MSETTTNTSEINWHNAAGHPAAVVITETYVPPDGRPDARTLDVVAIVDGVVVGRGRPVTEIAPGAPASAVETVERIGALILPPEVAEVVERRLADHDDRAAARQTAGRYFGGSKKIGKLETIVRRRPQVTLELSDNGGIVVSVPDDFRPDSPTAKYAGDTVADAIESAYASIVGCGGRGRGVGQDANEAIGRSGADNCEPTTTTTTRRKNILKNIILNDLTIVCGLPSYYANDLCQYVGSESRDEVKIWRRPHDTYTPHNQRRAAHTIAAGVVAGDKIFVTTNSDFLVKELNTMIMIRWHNQEDDYPDYTALDYRRISVYDAVRVDGRLDYVRCDINGEGGIEVPSFDAEINAQNEVQEKLMWS